ncbi:MAG: class I SAM-dependent methyltransferase [Sporolactobacillus sp.]|jgi:SAM-dependent methyltransferase|nr:class I SAM-dependent methyltransferase [Sporolactobacillus sp.]
MMNRLAQIRASEKAYHDHYYGHHHLFEEGSWLHKPALTVMALQHRFIDREPLRVLDLGCGVGRNSIPIAQTFKNPRSEVVCVDLLASAIEKLQQNSRAFGVATLLRAYRTDIADFPIAPSSYDYIVAVSSLEHIASEQRLEEVLRRIKTGTKNAGAVCLILNTDVEEIDTQTGRALTPMVEIRLSAERACRLLKKIFTGWEEKTVAVKPLEFHILRHDKPVLMKTASLTFAAVKP